MIVIVFAIIQIIWCNFDEKMRWGTYKPQLQLVFYIRIILHAVTQQNMKTFNPITGAVMYADQIGTDDGSLIYKIICENQSNSSQWERLQYLIDK